MKYHVKLLQEIFSPEFAEYISYTLMGEPSKADVAKQIMREIEHYETRRNVEFVSFFGKDFVIFKNA